MAVTKIFHSKFLEVLSFGKILGMGVLLLLGNPFHGLGSSGNFNDYIYANLSSTAVAEVTEIGGNSVSIPFPTFYCCPGVVIPNAGFSWQDIPKSVSFLLFSANEIFTKTC